MLVANFVSISALVVALAAAVIAFFAFIFARVDRRAQIEDDFMHTFRANVAAIADATMELLAASRNMIASDRWTADDPKPYDTSGDPEALRIPRSRLFTGLKVLPQFPAEYSYKINFLVSEGPRYIAEHGEEVLVECAERMNDMTLFDLRRRAVLRGGPFGGRHASKLFDRYFADSLKAAFRDSNGGGAAL